MSDPTKNLPWHVLNNSERAEPDWGVYDSTGQLVAWFPYGGHYARTSEQSEALARMVAAGSGTGTLHAENERLKSQIHELQLTTASQHTEYRELRKIAGELASLLRDFREMCDDFNDGFTEKVDAPRCVDVVLAAYAALNPQEKPTCPNTPEPNSGGSATSAPAT